MQIYIHVIYIHVTLQPPDKSILLGYCLWVKGDRKVWASVVSTYCKPSVTSYSSPAHAR